MRRLDTAELEGWLAAGGTARLRPAKGAEGIAVVELCECTGNLVELRESEDPAAAARLIDGAG